jgi:hypothetical protein
MLKATVPTTHTALLLFCRQMAVQIHKIQERREIDQKLGKGDE